MGLSTKGENSDGTDVIHAADEFEFEGVCDVYMNMTPLSAMQGTWTLNITLK